MHKQFICLNGEMLPAGDPSLYHNNRAFCYGDALFETIHANGTRLQFFSEHYGRLSEGMKTLRMDQTIPGKDILEGDLVRLLNKNHLYKGVRIRLSVFRNTGGFYSPQDNSVSYMAETIPLEHDHYTLNSKGLKTEIYKRLTKQADMLSNLKTANSILYIHAGIFKTEHKLDDCFIINTKGRLIEAISSNLFIVKDRTLYTPPLDEGCVAGIMRGQILRIAVTEGIDCMETPITEEDLISADECFLTNAVSGIRWVVAFRNKRFYNKTSGLLTASLNRELFGI